MAVPPNSPLSPAPTQTYITQIATENDKKLNGLVNTTWANWIRKLYDIIGGANRPKFALVKNSSSQSISPGSSDFINFDSTIFDNTNGAGLNGGSWTATQMGFYNISVSITAAFSDDTTGRWGIQLFGGDSLIQSNVTLYNECASSTANIGFPTHTITMSRTLYMNRLDIIRVRVYNFRATGNVIISSGNAEFSGHFVV